MLPSKERLRRSGVFQRAYNGRKSVVSRLFTLYCLPRTFSSGKSLKSGKPGLRPAKPQSASPAAEHNQAAGLPTGQASANQAIRMPLVGFVVSKKVFKRACDRNRVKRRAREAYRLIRTLIHTKVHQANVHETTEDSKENLYDVRGSFSEWYALVWVLNENGLTAPWQEICKRMEDCLIEAARKYGRRGRKTDNADH